MYICSMKTLLEEIKDSYAKELGFKSWEEMYYEEGYELGETGIDEIAIRYAEELHRQRVGQ